MRWDRSVSDESLSLLVDRISRGAAGGAGGAGGGEGAAGAGGGGALPSSPCPMLNPSFSADDIPRRGLQSNSKHTRKVLRNLRAINLTTDHKAMSDKEKKRMKQKGGFVVNGRVFGILAVSRAFGDRALKMSPQEYQIRKLKYLDISAELDIFGEENDNRVKPLSGQLFKTLTPLPFENDEVWKWAEQKNQASRSEAIKEQQNGKMERKETAVVVAEGEKEMDEDEDGESLKEDEEKKEQEPSQEQQAEGTGETKKKQEPRQEQQTEVINQIKKEEHELQPEANEKNSTERNKEKLQDQKTMPKREPLSEKDMKKRQENAIKKRLKAIKKEEEKAKERDRRMKEIAKLQERRGNAGEGVVVAQPDIDCHIISAEDRFILIATDGLWDVCSSKEAVKTASRLFVEANRELTESVMQNICLSLCNSAKSNGSGDDITCLLIALQPTLT